MSAVAAAGVAAWVMPQILTGKPAAGAAMSTPGARDQPGTGGARAATGAGGTPGAG